VSLNDFSLLQLGGLPNVLGWQSFAEVNQLLNELLMKHVGEAAIV
jgi:hypothetical protein